MKTAPIVFFLVLMSSVLMAQQWTLVSDLPIRGLERVSLDNRGQIFYTIGDGSIYQLSPIGVPINHYSPPRQAGITQLEAGWTVTVFTFSKDLQRYEMFDRFLNPLMSRDMDRLEVGLARAATLGNNNTLWVFDESDFSLKKIDYKRQALLQNQPLNLVINDQDWKVTDMREVQNMVFLRVPENIYIFDNQGNYLKSISVPGQGPLSISGGSIYWINSGKLVEYQMNRGVITSELALPSSVNGHHVKVHGKHVLFYNERQILIYLNPVITAG
jgi:hypothetical protein